MSWFDTKGLTNLAKSALKEAQKTFDKALDIQDEDNSPETDDLPAQKMPADSAPSGTSKNSSIDFFSSWNLTSSETVDILASEELPSEKTITESPSKTTAHSIWGSFTGSFFETPKGTEKQRTKQYRDKTSSLLSDDSKASEDSFSKSKLVVQNVTHESELVCSRLNTANDNDTSKLCDSMVDNIQIQTENHYVPKTNDSNANRLSLVSLDSSKNSSESLEVLGSHSIKSSPESDSFSSNQSFSKSISLNVNHNSDSVGVFSNSPRSEDELTKFDEIANASAEITNKIDETQNIDNDHNILMDNKQRPFENFELPPDDDDDTMSYNSVSESTAPTVFDTNDEPLKVIDYPITKPPARSNIVNPVMLTSFKDSDKKITDFTKEPVEFDLERPSRPLSHSNNSINFAGSCTSSNDGSLSDRTLNADSEIAMESSVDETQIKKCKNIDVSGSPMVLGILEDSIVDKLSDSSSFCNITYSGESFSTTRKDSSVSSFHSYDAAEKISHSELENISGQTDFHVREPTSPISSESRSDMVKIGSEETSGHTSGDENETTTSSDIEIIPSPNGDPGSIYCRQSPARAPTRVMKHLGNCGDRSSSPNVVDLVLGKSLATKVRGHNRELSGGSNQSTTSDDSHGSENERLMKRLSEMAEILESREKKLIEVSRTNIELTESNAELKVQLEHLQTKDSCDITLITDEYTQRLSALEKKFQQAIREKDITRKQIESMKQETASRMSSSDLEKLISERDDIIKDLREEGEKLSKQQLNYSNIIRKLRAMEKENEQVIKTLRDKIAEQNQELDKCKKSLTAKEFTECSQIEAVYKLTTANKKLETDLVETRGLLDDANHRLETAKTSLEVARKELKDLRENSQSLTKRKEALSQLENEKAQIETENDQLRTQLEELRSKAVKDEHRWMQREEHLRRELREVSACAAEAEALADGSERGIATSGSAGGALLVQLAALQQSALTRDRQHQAQLRRVQNTCSDLQNKLSRSLEVERLLREECDILRNRLQSTEMSLSASNHQLEQYTQNCSEHVIQITKLENEVQRLTSQLETTSEENKINLDEFKSRLTSAEHQLRIEKACCEAEKRRNVILQEQLKENSALHPTFPESSYNPVLSSSVLLTGDVSPPHSVGRDSLASEALGSSIWPMDDGSRTPPLGNSARTVLNLSSTLLAPVVENLQSALKQREGELKMTAEAARRYQSEKDAMNGEVARLTAELDNLQTLQHQYDALLQMYGEKEEQLQELRLDLQDVKDMYKMQLDEILMLKKQAAQWSTSSSKS